MSHRKQIMALKLLFQELVKEVADMSDVVYALPSKFICSVCGEEIVREDKVTIQSTGVSYSSGDRYGKTQTPRPAYQVSHPYAHQDHFEEEKE